MRLLEHADVPLDRAKRVYRDASWRAVGLVALIMMALPMVIVWANPHDRGNLAMVAFTAVVGLAFFALFLRRFILDMAKSNWFVAQAEEGLYINFGPCRGPRKRVSGPGVVFVPRGEIAAVGKTHETRRFDGPFAVERHIAYIDLYLKHEDTAPLQRALRRERRQWPPGKDMPCPVRLPAPGVVRLLWDRVHPPENAAITLLIGEYPPMADRSVCYADWERLTEEEKQHIVADLWETGYVAEAMRLHRLTTGDDLRRTRAYFAGLTQDR